MGRYAIHRKDRSEPAIRKAFEALGCQWVTLHEPVDALVCISGVNVLIETKNPEARPRAYEVKQTAFIRSWQGPCHYVRTLDDVRQLVTAIRRQIQEV